MGVVSATTIIRRDVHRKPGSLAALRVLGALFPDLWRHLQVNSAGCAMFLKEFVNFHPSLETQELPNFRFRHLLIPEASAAHPEQPSVKAHIYHSPWFREQQEMEANQQSNPAVAQEEEEPALPSAEPAPAAAPDARNSGLDSGQNSVLNSVLDHGPQTGSASGPVSDPPRPPDTRAPLLHRQDPLWQPPLTPFAKPEARLTSPLDAAESAKNIEFYADL